MKNALLFLASLIFSLLFYQQYIGLNVVLFSITAIAVLFIFNPKKFKEKETILKASILIFTSVFVFMHHSLISLIATIISFVVLVGTISNTNSSIYVKFLNGLYTTIVAVFSRYFERDKNSESTSKKQKIDYLYWLKIIGIPLVIVTVFVLLYRNINPIFNDIISTLDLSFINMSWLLFTGLGYYLFYNISQPISIEPATESDLQTDNILRKEDLKQEPEEKIKQENQLGVVLMISLNVLLLFLIITDFVYLKQQSYDVSSTELKSQLHQSVNALIVSIILAMSIIVYFFRGNLNFFDRNKLLKNTTFIWISLNIVIAFITAYKNFTYITNYGITYKRIGVYVYLFLVITGLIFTFIKISSIKNIVFLFRKNMQVAFIVLVLATTINWDVFITKYNLSSNHKSINYLLKLSNKNAFLLKEYSDNNNLSIDEKEKIDFRYNVYYERLKNNSWQEKVYQNFKNN